MTAPRAGSGGSGLRRLANVRARRAVHQFHASSAYGDAVTNSLFFTQRLLRGLGFQSEIYVEHIHPKLTGQLKHYREHRPSADDVLVVHHSMGHDLTDWLVGLPDRKILVYHNITPPEFFPDDANLRKYAEIGRQQLVRFRTAMVAAATVSEFNADELRRLGYDDVAVLPLLLDADRVRAAPWDAGVAEANAGVFTVLFVGRMERNKCQHDVMRVFRHVARWLDRPAKLVFVGHYNPHAGYIHELRELARAYGIEDRVTFRGHVSTEELLGWYRAADVFLCMSEHEGFGVPLIEAMLFDVPVIAYDSSNIPHTLGGAGILVHEKAEEEIAALVCLLAQDRALRRTVLRAQRARVVEFSTEDLRAGLVRLLGRAGLTAPAVAPAPDVSAAPIGHQIEGPFETSYSLAIVNRELALALERRAPGTVALFATEGPGDYAPDAAAIAALPDVERLWRRGRKRSRADVVVRDLYPPRVADMDGLVNVLYFAWEESGLDPAWVAQFNRHLDAIAVPSRYVKKVLRDAGVRLPIGVIGYGVDQIRRETPRPYAGPLGDGFRFLHVSSGFPRKGIDVLLEAYARAFSASDGVTLVVKTFPNVHNRVAEQLRDVRAAHPACPPIVLIDRDVPGPELADIYRQCQAFVAPSRGEGFGLPMAEAMTFGLPVVTTAYGGQTDFCTDETAWTVDYRFARSESHLAVPGSVWAEPDVDDLARALRAVRDAAPDAIERKVTRARALVAERLSWDRPAALLGQLEDAVMSARPLSDRPLRLGWVTTWNGKCGVAAYSRSLLSHLPADAYAPLVCASETDAPVRSDEPNVRRCFADRTRPDLADLERALLDPPVDVVVFQFNFCMYDLATFGALVERLCARGISVLIVFHSTHDVDGFSLRQIRTALAHADRLLVHGVADLNTLKSFGLVENVALLPHGVIRRQPREPHEARARLGIPTAATVIASYGFLLPHKGVTELVRAFPAVLAAHPDAILLLVNALYPVAQSKELEDAIRALVAELGLEERVLMVTEFLEDDESLALLECADVVVYPYQATAESSSAAVRMGLACGRPVACTPLPIFDDVADVVHRLPGTHPSAIAAGLTELLGDADARNAVQVRRERWLAVHSWDAVGARLDGMIRGLVADAVASAAGPEQGLATGEQGRTSCSA